MRDVQSTEEQPHDHMTELAGVMVAALESEEGSEDVRAFVLLSHGRDAGAVVHGYEDQDVMLSHLMSHVEAIFASRGLQLTVHVVDDPETS